uniref:Uncharacterized protein n=1 Tax=Canis lupus dingo TaxID=286419 RepID=A0A8C0JZR5_CANLU
IRAVVGLAAHLPAGRAPPGLEKRLCMATAAVPGRAGDLGDPTVRPALALVAPGSAPPCAPLAVSSQVHSTWFLDFLTQDLDLGRDRIIIFFFSLDPGSWTRKGQSGNCNFLNTFLFSGTQTKQCFRHIL